MFGKWNKYSSSKLARIVSSIYGITCDEVDGEKIDTIPNTKCPNCLERKLVEDNKFGEQVKEIEYIWNKRDITIL